MQYTAHCLERWNERVDPDGRLSISECFDKSVFVWRGANLNKKVSDFYVNGDIIFVVKSENVITVYKADYGFGESIDREICGRLLKQVLELNEQIEKESSRIEDECDALEREMRAVDDEITILSARIDQLTSKSNKLTEQMNELRRGLKTLEAERDCQAKKLVFTPGWKVESVSRGNGKR